MAKRIKMRQVLSALILFSAVLKCMLVEDGQGIARKDADPLGTMATDARDSAHFPGRVLFEDSSSQFDVAAMTEPCHHQRDIADLQKQLEVLRKHVIRGDSSAVKSLLDKWSAHDVYVHNLNNLPSAKDQDYPQIQCSDLDYLARYQVSYAESIYDNFYQVNYANVSYMTMLELALHMTKGANQRALTLALNKNEEDVGNQGERSEDRVKIIRFLLEKGFLWGSGDLVCTVVNPQSGYHTVVREAFARIILHDLVRDLVHLNRTRINYLRQHCGRNGMDGVVWILGTAPGAFTLLGALSHKTVLMKAAKDDTNHDEAFINFPELIDLHKVLHEPVTTVDLDGWNAEMHAARVLKEEHVKLLKETTLEMWQQQGRDAFSMVLLGESASDNLSGACIFLALNVNTVAYIGACFFICCLLLYASLITCKKLCPGGATFDRLLCCIGVFYQGGCSVLWLITLNTAFLNFPPELIIAWETQTDPFGIPSVSKWNPLPATVKLICCFSIIVLVVFGVLDYLDVLDMTGKSRAGKKKTPGPAEPDDRYQDPQFHFIGCVCVFGLMTLLMFIYVKIVLKPLEMDPKRMGLWLGSLLVQVKITLEGTLTSEQRPRLRRVFDQSQGSQSHSPLPITSEGESHEDEDEDEGEDKRCQALWDVVHHWYRWACCMVTPFNPKMWHLLMYAHKRNPNSEQLRIQKEDGKEDGKEDVPAEGQWSCFEMNSRFAMSYISNGLYKAIIVYTLPLWLSRGGLADFVLNAFATVYIVELDDVTDRETWKLMPPQAPGQQQPPPGQQEDDQEEARSKTPNAEEGEGVPDRLQGP
eukprot:s2199_g7.t1